MKKLFVLLLIVLIPISCSIFEPNGSIQFVDKILNGYFIYNIAFESDGTAWMEARDIGLIRYEPDGTMEIFNHTNSIINEQTYIKDIKVDSQDRVWFGNDGLVCYDGEFTRYDSSNSDIPGGFVNHLAIGSDDKLWFSASGESMQEGGLGCCNNGNIVMYTKQNSNNPISRIGDIAIDQEENIWIVPMSIIHDTCMAKFDGAGWTVYDTTDFGFKPYHIGKIMINSNNELIGFIDYWLSSSTVPEDAPHMFIYDGVSFEILSDYSGNSLTSLIDKDGDIWYHGYGKITLVSGEETIHKLILYEPYSIFESPNGEMWVGSRNGVYIYRKN